MSRLPRRSAMLAALLLTALVGACAPDSGSARQSDCTYRPPLA